ncbi:MAG: hypothetical protein AAFY78_21725 [Cyanobacteria bacterium J06648_16]
MSKLPQPKSTETEAGAKARQGYLEMAQKVVGDADMDYTDLYQRFVLNDWAAIKLDDSVAMAALKSGKSPKEASILLIQGPYVQHQVHVKQVATLTMSRYVQSTVQRAFRQLQGSRQSPSDQLQTSQQQKTEIER